MRPPVHGGATLAAGCRAENYVAQEPVSHPQHIAAGYRRNITSGATFSVLCVTQHKVDFTIATVDKTNADGSTGASVVSEPQFLGNPTAPLAYEAGKKIRSWRIPAR